MINIRFINILIFLVCVCPFESIYSQSKYGIDSITCMENRAIYNMHYKQKNYDEAIAPWRRAYNICPASSENIYKHGPILIKNMMKKNPSAKQLYLDSLMLMFDKRIKYFGKKEYVLGLKGYELVIADSKRSFEALEMLEKSINKLKNKSGPQQIYAYLKAIVNLERSGVKSKEDVLEAYSYIMPIVEHNIENQSKKTKYFIKYQQKIEDMFSNYANCDDLVALFDSRFSDLKEDISFLRRSAKLLSNKECEDTDIYFKISSNLYSIDPTSSSAFQMSKMSLSRGNNSDAIKFAKEAIEMEENLNNKASYHILLADAYRNSGSYSLARAQVYKALEIKKNWGKAYITLGNTYVSGAKKCGNDFERASVYWIAVDAFKQAINDERFKDLAYRSINTYSKQFPNKEECFFNGLQDGEKYSIGCWINKSTIVRTRD